MNELISIFYILTGLGLLLWLMMVEYPRLQLEKTREELYGLRRQLFCIGQKHEIFHQRAYTMNRYIINGMLSYIDNFSFFQFIAVVTIEDVINEQKSVIAYKKELERACRNLSPEAVRDIDDIRNQVNNSVISYIVKTSPVALPLLFVFTLFFYDRQGNRVYKLCHPRD